MYFTSSMTVFSFVVPLLLTIVEGDKFREDFKSILFSTFTSSSASWHWKKDLYEAMLD